MARIFISYARDDGSEIAQELSNRLRALNHEVFLDIQGIPGGSEWEKQLIQRGRWCDVLLLLVTQASNQSRYVYHEFREAEKNKKLIVPVQVNATPLPPYVTHLNVLPFEDGGYDSLLLKLEVALRQVPPAGTSNRSLRVFAIAAVLVAVIAVAAILADNFLRGPGNSAETPVTQEVTGDANGETPATQDVPREASGETPIATTVPAESVDMLAWYLGREAGCDVSEQDDVMSITGSECSFRLGLAGKESTVLSADFKLPSADALPQTDVLGAELSVTDQRSQWNVVCGLGIRNNAPGGYFYVYGEPKNTSPLQAEWIDLDFDRHSFQLEADPLAGKFTCAVDGQLLGSYRPNDATSYFGQSIYPQIFLRPPVFVSHVDANAMPGYGTVDVPSANASVSGMMEVAGWVVVSPGVDHVELLLDGEVVGQARYGLSRDGVARDYPALAGAAQSGFTGQIDTRKYANGNHNLEVWVVDTTGARSRVDDVIAVSFRN